MLLRNKFNEEDVLEHGAGVEMSLDQFPGEAKAFVESGVFPIQELLNLEPSFFWETDDGPEGAAERAGAAETAEEDPLELERKSLRHDLIDAAHRRPELFRSHAGEEGGWEVGAEPIVETKDGEVPRTADEDRLSVETAWRRWVGPFVRRRREVVLHRLYFHHF